MEEDEASAPWGHGISDVDVGEILQVDQGELYQADILSVVKGQDGVPGELKGVIRYYPEEKIGEIQTNSGVGIYGTPVVPGNVRPASAPGGNRPQAGGTGRAGHPAVRGRRFPERI